MRPARPGDLTLSGGRRRTLVERVTSRVWVWTGWVWAARIFARRAERRHLSDRKETRG